MSEAGLGTDQDDAQCVTRVVAAPLEAVYPHFKGLIRVKYDAGKAEIELPEGLTGEFVWKGETTPLKSGKVTLSMP